MQKKMFGHRVKKGSFNGRDPGRPINSMGESYGTDDNKPKDVYEGKSKSSGASKENPPGYEGKEHVKYKNPGFSKHDVRFPQDEPHMKSRNTKQEAHEMEDNFHMGIPKQTKDTLEKKIPRARMKMDAPDQEDPDALRGNPVSNVGRKGVKDTSGEEEMGPNDMQSNMSKEHRKKMIIAVTKRKMKKMRE